MIQNLHAKFCIYIICINIDIYYRYIYIYIYLFFFFQTWLYNSHVPRLSPDMHNLNCTFKCTLDNVTSIMSITNQCIFKWIECVACCTHTYTHKVKHIIMLIMKKLHVKYPKVHSKKTRNKYVGLLPCIPSLLSHV